MIKYIFWTAVGFFSGSVMYSYLLPKWLYKKDITKISKDGNPGCGNVFTYVGVPCGAVCLTFELAKGAVPLWLALKYLQIDNPMFAAVMVAPVIGHAFSPMLKRRGGKAIAVTFGTFIGLFPEMLVLFWLALPLIVFSTVIRIVPHSLRVMVSYIAMFFNTVAMENCRTAWIGAFIITSVVLYRHLNDYITREKREFNVYILSHRLFGRRVLQAESSHSDRT